MSVGLYKCINPTNLLQIPMDSALQNTARISGGLEAGVQE